MQSIKYDPDGERRAAQLLKRQICYSCKVPPTGKYLRQYGWNLRRSHYAVGIRSGVSYIKAWRQIPYRQRLAATEFIFYQLEKNIKKGGVSFRTFIYNYLGFDYGAYMPLFMAGGLDITNFIIEGSEDNGNVQS
jgi:hypothetical protein